MGRAILGDSWVGWSALVGSLGIILVLSCRTTLAADVTVASQADTQTWAEMRKAVGMTLLGMGNVAGAALLAPAGNCTSDGSPAAPPPDPPEIGKLKKSFPGADFKYGDEKDVPSYRQGLKNGETRGKLIALHGQELPKEVSDWIKLHYPKNFDPRRLGSVCPMYSKSPEEGGLTEPQKGLFWQALVESIIKPESNFNINLDYWEKSFEHPKYSGGLLQMSMDDAPCKPFLHSMDDLHDPLLNVKCGLAVMDRISQNPKYKNEDLIAADKKGNGALGAYWSTVRNSESGPRTEFMNQLVTRLRKYNVSCETPGKSQSQH